MQLTLPTMPEHPDRPTRRCRWQAELARQASFFADQRARDAARHDAALARVDRQLADIRDRISDVEHSTGCADIASAPRSRTQLRAYASGR